MKKIIAVIAMFLVTANACGQSHLLPDAPDGAQAVSLFGEPLTMPAPRQALLDNLAEAKANYDADPMNVVNIIWYGRRMAYTGDYRGQ